MRARIAVAACLLVSGCCLKAQTVSYGVVGGVLLAGPPGSSEPYLHREDKRYTFGPLIEVGFTKHLAVEFSPLYKRLGYSNTLVTGDFSQCSPSQCISPPLTYFVVRGRVNAWEFPIVGKYYFTKPRRHWRPFVLTGYSFSKTWISTRQSGSATELVPVTNSGTSFSTGTALGGAAFDFTTPLVIGAVFGGGIVEHKGPAWIGPEFRYTRNGASGQNQAEVLISVRF